MPGGLGTPPQRRGLLDAVGADSIPDPTTEGDFCRRFGAEDLDDLRQALDDARLNVWRRQTQDFFAEAVIDLDSTLVITTGECKSGMDISYKGEWGYHPLLVTLANTSEVLNIINRSGNRPSEEGAAAAADLAIGLCRRGGFRRIRLRGPPQELRLRLAAAPSSDTSLPPSSLPHQQPGSPQLTAQRRTAILPAPNTVLNCLRDRLFKD